MSETIDDQLPEAVKRIGRWLGTEKVQAMQNREFLFDLMALHAAGQIVVAEQFLREQAEG